MVTFAQQNSEALIKPTTRARGQDRSRILTASQRLNSPARTNLRRSTYKSRARLGSCSRDPIGFEGSHWDLYEYVGSSSLRAADPNGTDIYVIGGNNTWNPINNAIHINLCIDTWKSCNPPKPDGQICFSFGLNIKKMCGEVYACDPPEGILSLRKMLKRKKTTCQEDVKFLDKLIDEIGVEGPYGPTRSCRWWVNGFFRIAPGVSYDWKCVEYSEPDYEGRVHCLKWDWVLSQKEVGTHSVLD